MVPSYRPTRYAGLHLEASPQSCPAGILQQTRPLAQSASEEQAVTGQHFEPFFIAMSKSSWDEQGKQSFGSR